MKARATFHIQGDRELIVQLERLKGAVRRKTTRRAVTVAIRPVRMAAKRFTPKDTGELRKNLTMKVKTYKNGNVFGMVGVKNEKNEATGRRPSKYMHLVHEGTKPHLILPRRKKVLVSTNLGSGRNTQITRTVFGRFVRHPGAKKNEFLTDAIEGLKEATFKRFGDEMRKGILAEAAKSK